MLKFSGPAGCLYRLGEPLAFTGALEDCGDGFEWRAADPSLRFWIDDPLAFSVSCGDAWEPLESVEVWRPSGRVAFGRCYRGEHRRVSGVCLPLALACETGEWTAEVHTVVKKAGQTLGQNTIEASPGPRIARFPGLYDAPEGRVLARLVGWEANYLFVGTGDSIVSTRSGTVLTFDEKGIVYVRS